MTDPLNFRSLAAFFGLLFLTGCHLGARPHSVNWDEVSPEQRRRMIVRDAQGFLHAREIRVGGRRFPFDCSGLVGAVLYRGGMDVFGGAGEEQIHGNGTKILHEYVQKHGAIFEEGLPKPGDLVFFSNTYDRNRDGQLNDPLTHVGVVEEVSHDGTVKFIHNVRNGVRRYVMNLNRPLREHDDAGEKINSHLRRKQSGDPKGTTYLTSTLFDGYGSLFPRATEVTKASP